MAEQVGGSERAEIVVNRDGRILIPAQVRRDLGLTAGSTLLLSVEDGRMVIESRAQLVPRMRREIAESWQGDPTGFGALLQVWRRSPRRGQLLPPPPLAAATLAPEDKRGKAIAVVTTGLTFGTAFGCPLGTAVAAVVGWRATI